MRVFQIRKLHYIILGIRNASAIRFISIFIKISVTVLHDTFDINLHETSKASIIKPVSCLITVYLTMTKRHIPFEC